MIVINPFTLRVPLDSILAALSVNGLKAVGPCMSIVQVFLLHYKNYITISIYAIKEFRSVLFLIGTS